MYKLDATFDHISLLDSIVVSVSYFVSEIRILFSNNSKYKEIVIFGSLCIEIKGEKRHFNEIYPINEDYGLLNIIDRKVTEVKINDSRTELSIFFGEHIVISIENDDFFETLHIRDGDGKTLIMM